MSVSAIVFCFNEELNVPDTLDALLRARILNPSLTEIVVVDDASQDGTWSVMEGYAAANPESIRCVRHETNLGAAQAVSTGAATATADFVLIVPGDFTYDTDAICDMLRTHESAPFAEGVILGIRAQDRIQRSWAREQAASLARWSLLWVAPRRGPLPNYGFILCPTWLVRRVPSDVRRYGQAIGLLGVMLQTDLPYATTPVVQVPGSNERGSSLSLDKVLDVLAAHRSLLRARRANRAFAKSGHVSVER